MAVNQSGRPVPFTSLVVWASFFGTVLFLVNENMVPLVYLGKNWIILAYRSAQWQVLESWWRHLPWSVNKKSWVRVEVKIKVRFWDKIRVCSCCAFKPNFISVQVPYPNLFQKKCSTEFFFYFRFFLFCIWNSSAALTGRKFYVFCITCKLSFFIISILHFILFAFVRAFELLIRCNFVYRGKIEKLSLEITYAVCYESKLSTNQLN